MTGISGEPDTSLSKRLGHPLLEPHHNAPINILDAAAKPRCAFNKKTLQAFFVQHWEACITDLDRQPVLCAGVLGSSEVEQLETPAAVGIGQRPEHIGRLLAQVKLHLLPEFLFQLALKHGKVLYGPRLRELDIQRAARQRVMAISGQNQRYFHIESLGDHPLGPRDSVTDGIFNQLIDSRGYFFGSGHQSRDRMVPQYLDALATQGLLQRVFQNILSHHGQWQRRVITADSHFASPLGAIVQAHRVHLIRFFKYVRQDSQIVQQAERVRVKCQCVAMCPAAPFRVDNGHLYALLG